MGVIQPKVLLDAVYINNSGGKVLLDYLISEIEKSGLNVYYLLDNRVKNNHPAIQSGNYEYLEASAFKRYKFYKKHTHSFSTIFCFANVPPAIKSGAKVYVYFHQLLFLDHYFRHPFSAAIKLRLKRWYIASVKSNCDTWLVQTEHVKLRLAQGLRLNANKINILPFYPSLPKPVESRRHKGSFLYVSSGARHKNQLALLKAAKAVHNSGYSFKLGLTVSEEFPELRKQVNYLIGQGVPIENHGFVPREELSSLNAQYEYVIFPSLGESLGLGLLEGMEAGCNIIGSDLPYLHDICVPSAVFNPEVVNEIAASMMDALEGNLPKTINKVSNKIEDVLSILN